MTHHIGHIFLGTLFILAPAHLLGMEINADEKKDYVQIIDTENGDQIDLNKKLPSWPKRLIDHASSLLPSAGKNVHQNTIWLGFWGVYSIALILNVVLVHSTYANNPYDCAAPRTNFCLAYVQPVTCCCQPHSGYLLDQCLSAVPSICPK